LLFQGEGFANAPEGSPLFTLQSILVDFFHNGNNATALDLEAIDLALVFTSAGDKVVMRGHRVRFGKKQKDSKA
jgi:hypothetical protein